MSSCSLPRIRPPPPPKIKNAKTNFGEDMVTGYIHTTMSCIIVLLSCREAVRHFCFDSCGAWGTTGQHFTSVFFFADRVTSEITPPPERGSVSMSKSIESFLWNERLLILHSTSFAPGAVQVKAAFSPGHRLICLGLTANNNNNNNSRIIHYGNMYIG